MIDREPRVSVVMPSMNQARFIGQAIDSVLQQTYPNVELIVVDGGSNDGTLGVLESRLGRFGQRLRWVSEPDSGAANAINKALRLADGDIIGWLNSDDLYAADVITHAVQRFVADSSLMMLYGEGEHVDAQGAPLGRYPTRPPSASIQGFHDGCYICQPTVFLRRTVLDAVGLLDEGLRTAFDFEYWLRVFKQFPQGVAHVDRVHAYSRLHDDCITMKMRRTVALEAMRLLARHVGVPRPHWLESYLSELCSVYPFDERVPDLAAEFFGVVKEAREFLTPDGYERLMGSYEQDARLRLALPGAYASVSPDGWAPPTLALRIRKTPSTASILRLSCVNASPLKRPLTLRTLTSSGKEDVRRVESPGPFHLDFDLRELTGSQSTILVTTEPSFVPAQVEPGSRDARALAFRIERTKFVEADADGQLGWFDVSRHR